jgi:serine protease Do
LLFLAAGTAIADSVSRAARKILPAVVQVESVVVDYSSGTAEKTLRTGSGMIYRADGFVITNEHVVRDSSRLHCRLQDGRRIKAEVVGRHVESDVAVLRLQMEQKARLPSVRFGRQSRVKAGDTVLVLGNPKRLQQTVTLGIVSHPRRYYRRLFGSTSADFGGLYHWVQTDAVIEPGSSGAPVVNLRGQVVGMATRHTGEDLGLAIPGDYLHEMAERLRVFGKAGLSDFGFEIQSLEEASLADKSGAVISHVRPGSSAANEGLRPGDVLLKLGGFHIDARRKRDLPVAEKSVAFLDPGNVYTAKLKRGGQVVTVQLVAAEAEPAHGRYLECEHWGFAVQEMSPKSRRIFGHHGHGLRVAGVKPGSKAHGSGLRTNDILVALDNQRIRTIEGLRKIHDEHLELPDAEPIFVVHRGRESLPFFLSKARPRAPIKRGDAMPGHTTNPVPVQVESKTKRLQITIETGHETHSHPVPYNFKIFYRPISATGMMLRPDLPVVVSDPVFANSLANRSFSVYWPGGAKTKGRLVGQLRASSLGFIQTSKPDNLPAVVRPPRSEISKAAKAWFKLTPPEENTNARIRDQISGSVLQTDDSSHARFLPQDHLPRTEGIVYDASGKWQGLLIPSLLGRKTLMTPARRILDFAAFFSIQEFKPGQRTWLGLHVRPLDSLHAGAWGLFKNEVVVTRVESSSPAEEAGFRIGDIIREVDGIPPPGERDTRSSDFDDMFLYQQPGKKVEFKILRETEELALTAVLEKAGKSLVDAVQHEVEPWALQFTELTNEVRDGLLLPPGIDGMVISKAEKGEATVAGLRLKDVVLSVDGVAMSPKLISKILENPSRQRLLLFWRSGMTRFVKVPR